MQCIVTAGPSYEPLDEVRRLTNFSTGALGTGLANFLTEHGHDVTLLRSQIATFPGETKAKEIILFGTSDELAQQLEALASRKIEAIFHAAAVSDFKFGRVWERASSGELREVQERKISTAKGPLMAELIPAKKLIGQLRAWFPEAVLVGWKYEIEGGRSRILQMAREQIAQNRTDACVANGPAYGRGFGLVLRSGSIHDLSDALKLYEKLLELKRPEQP